MLERAARKSRYGTGENSGNTTEHSTEGGGGGAGAESQEGALAWRGDEFEQARQTRNDSVGGIG